MDGIERGYKYKDCKIFTFPRSGTWYMTALMYENFFNDGSGHDWKFRFPSLSPHCYPFRIEEKNGFNGDYLIINVVRDFEAVSKSLYRARWHFGYREDLTYDEFITKNCNEMCNRVTGKPSEKLLLNNRQTRREGVFKRHFNKDFPFRQSYDKYHEVWRPYHSHKHVIKIQYDKLINDFDQTMLKIAKRLGSNKTEFVDIDKKVGYYMENDKQIKAKS